MSASFSRAALGAAASILICVGAASAQSPDTFTALAARTIDGVDPEATLIQATEGNFYGTTVSGGVANRGTVTMS